MSIKMNCLRVMTVLAVLGFCPGAWALEKKGMITLEPDLNYYHFNEKGFKENGVMGGMDAAFTYRGQLITENLPKGMAKIDGKILVSRVDFKGTLYDGNTYSVNRVRDFLGEIRGLVGYDFSVFSSTTLTPYTGIGYRYLKDQLQKINAGYRRESNYLYSPLGIETSTPISPGWSAGVNAEFDVFWHGWQNTILGDLDPGFSDVNNEQTKGFGLKASLKVRHQMEDKNFVFEPYVDYWNIGNSDTVKVIHNGIWGGGQFQEKKNTSTMLGMKVALEF